MAPESNPLEIEKFVRHYIATSESLESRSKRMKRAISAGNEDSEPLEVLKPASGQASNILSTYDGRPLDTNTRKSESVYYDALERQSDDIDLDSVLEERTSKSFLDEEILNIQLPMAEGSMFSKLFQVLEQDADRLHKLGIINWSICLYTMDDVFYE